MPIAFKAWPERPPQEQQNRYGSGKSFTTTSPPRVVPIQQLICVRTSLAVYASVCHPLPHLPGRASVHDSESVRAPAPEPKLAMAAGASAARRRLPTIF